jgi:hypothetical protein
MRQILHAAMLKTANLAGGICGLKRLVDFSHRYRPRMHYRALLALKSRYRNRDPECRDRAVSHNLLRRDRLPQRSITPHLTQYLPTRRLFQFRLSSRAIDGCKLTYARFDAQKFQNR